ncbi:MAG: glycosyltransferase [Bacteroidia bacterium]
MFTQNPSILSLILLSVLGLCILVQLVYHFYYFLSLPKQTDVDFENVEWTPVSIVVCAQNEIDNLKILIPALLEQDYPKFELIIIEDASWDESKEYLEELEENESRLKVVYITEGMKKNYLGKKLGLSLGIKASKNPILIFTDADCVPESKMWLKHMAFPYHQNSNTEIVLGYSPFEKANTLINLISRMDNAYTGLMYLSFANKKQAYMGVGRNLSYKRDLFFKNNGFAKHLHIAPGDDDLFVNQNCNAKNTAICIHTEAFVNTHAKTSFYTWFRQKKRHNFAGKYYKSKDQFKLGLYASFHALLWISFVANLFVYESLGWALILLGLYWLIKWPIIYNSFKKLKQTGIVIWMPIFDILYVFYNVFFGLVAIFGRQKKW